MSDSYIRKIRIIGLYGKKSVCEIDFLEGVNCLYGVNGSGKTTIINLITACLSCDVEMLAGIPFTAVHIFTTKSGNKRPFRFLSVYCKDGQSGNGDHEKGLLHMLEKKGLSSYAKYKNHVVGYDSRDKQIVFEVDGDSFLYPPFFMDRGSSDLSKAAEKISSNIKLTHLPLTRIHASEAFNFDGEDFDIISNLRRRKVSQHEIRKLLDTGAQVLSKIEKDFNALHRKKQNEVNVELENLKARILNRLLIEKSQLDKDTRQVLKKAIKSKYIISEIIAKLKVANIFTDEDKVVEHFEVWELAIRELQEAEKDFNAELDSNKKWDQRVFKRYMDAHSRALSFASTFERFFSVVDDVTEMQKKKEEKMAVFESFKKVTNGFLVNKELAYSKNMEFTISSTKDGIDESVRKIDLSELSSGEKHIIAILGRVALQESENSVFIADEPELSLHLEWQRKILPAVKEMSPTIQIIVATHSPAIIPSDANMIDVEECFSYV